MPRLLPMFALASLVMISQGCGCGGGDRAASHEGAKPAPVSQAASASATKTYMMLDGGRQVLRLTAPAEARCELANGSFDMRSRDGYVNIWLVRGAKSIDEGVQRIGETIVSEFKEFKPVNTTSIPLTADRGIGGGGSAARVMGTGVEADDNDPGKADVIVFQKGGKVFIACTHGETMRSTAQELMVALVRTASTP
jgi:hypothetical protein